MSNCCLKEVRTTAVVDLGAILVLFIPPVLFRKREEFKLIICQTLPPSTPGLDPQVIITDGVNVYLVFNKLSEFVRRDNIECRTCFYAIASNDPLHIQLKGLSDSCKCPNEYLTAVATPVITPATVTVGLIVDAVTALLEVTLPVVTGGVTNA